MHAGEGRVHAHSILLRRNVYAPRCDLRCACKVLAIIFIGCVLQFIYLFRVLLLGATYNQLQARHLSILVATQVRC